MKTIMINFSDFWPGFNSNNNFFINRLREYFDVKIVKDPDYLIYSDFGNDYLNFKCVRIYYTGENIRPDFNLCDYAIGSDWITFGDRYFRLPHYYLYENDLNLAQSKHLFTEDDLLIKTEFCNFIYSNSMAQRERGDFYNLLNTYKKVDSGGRYMNNIGGPVKDKLSFQSKYKFTIAFENSSAPGYSTEKIIQALAAKTLPIYWGDPLIDKQLNTKSFINCHEYKSFEDVLKKVVEIDNDDNQYMYMMRERVFLEQELPEKILEKFNLFLIQIFIGEPSQAFRRSFFIRTITYESKIQFADKYYKHPNIYRRLMNRFKQITKKIVHKGY